VQVEEVRLSLRGRPLGVQQNMEIAAVNYEARAFGLHNRISVAEGVRLCPQLVLVRGDNGVNAMQRYRCAGQAVLRCVMTALDGENVPVGWAGRSVEHASFDDFFVELPQQLAAAPASTAIKIPAAVLEKDVPRSEQPWLDESESLLASWRAQCVLASENHTSKARR